MTEARGHGTDNTEITILVYSSLSLSAPQMVCRVVAAELTETLVKNDPRQHVACDRVSRVRCAASARELCGFI